MSTGTLFDVVDTKTERPDILTTIARRKLNLDAPYTNCGWKVVEPDGLIIRIAERYIRSKGKYKGKPGWRGEIKECITTQAEIEQEELKWERETGKCHNCGGDGQENCGWHHETGPRYRTCTRCNGNGIPPSNS